jgi:hypothetical protein
VWAVPIAESQAEPDQPKHSGREVDMIRQFQSAVRLLIAATAVVGIVLVAVPTAGSVQAAGLTNCTEMSTSKPRSGCWEDVWVGGVEHRMVFATGWGTQFKGNVPDDLDGFYVIAPQEEPPQSLAASFRHDHVVRDIPTANHGDYNVRLHGYFVVCSAAGIASGACVFEMNSPQPGFTLPFAKTVNGQALTSVEPLEAAVDAGLITLFDTGAVIVGSIQPKQ